MPDRADRGLECPSPLPVLRPDLQISFYQRLQELRGLYLYDALQTTYAGLDIPTLDRELAAYVPAKDLRRVASFGLRGEVFFAVPCLLRQNPRILGYYRLLYGLSQKEFYRATTFGCLRRLEEAGDMSPALEARLDELCASLAQTGAILVDGIEPLSLSVAQELQLLTIGPQLRGGQNARLGQGATAQVFKLIADLVRPYVTERTKRLLRLRNSSGRIVEIEFSSDPDIRVTEQLESGVRKALAMEIKGGTDVSNVHNRLGKPRRATRKPRPLASRNAGRS